MCVRSFRCVSRLKASYNRRSYIYIYMYTHTSARFFCYIIITFLHWCGWGGKKNVCSETIRLRKRGGINFRADVCMRIIDIPDTLSLFTGTKKFVIIVGCFLLDYEIGCEFFFCRFEKTRWKRSEFGVFSEGFDVESEAWFCRQC